MLLTNNRLIFKLHQLNIQKGQTNINYQNVIIQKTTKLDDNGLRFVNNYVQTYDFVVNEREVWLKKNRYISYPFIK